MKFRKRQFCIISYNAGKQQTSQVPTGFRVPQLPLLSSLFYMLLRFLSASRLSSSVEVKENRAKTPKEEERILK